MNTFFNNINSLSLTVGSNGNGNRWWWRQHRQWTAAGSELQQAPSMMA